MVTVACRTLPVTDWGGLTRGLAFWADAIAEHVTAVAINNNCCNFFIFFATKEYWILLVKKFVQPTG